MSYSCEVLTPLGGTGVPTVWMKNNKKWLNNYAWHISTVKGEANARNELLKKAVSPLILWIDSDIELEFDPVPLLYKIMQKFNVSGVCAGQLTVGDKWFLQVAAGMDKIEIARHNGIKIVEARAFQCALYKREDLLKIGGFDPAFNVAGTDNDAARRMIAAGMLVLHSNKIVVKHHISEQTYWRKMKNYRVAANKLATTMKEEYQPEVQGQMALYFKTFRHMPLKFLFYKIKEIISRR